jgi:hypothetical protein
MNGLLFGIGGEGTIEEPRESGARFTLALFSY